MVHRRSSEKLKKRKQEFKEFEQRKKEEDTVRSIIKDLNQRDPVTGEIAYDHANTSEIKHAILTGVYCYEEPARFASPHCPAKTEKVWASIDKKFVETLSDFEQGELLNRALNPCWWR